MAEHFSPTGYWALYQEGDFSTHYLPVVSFDFVAPGISSRRIAMVGHEDGWLTAVTELEGFGDFVMITTVRSEE